MFTAAFQPIFKTLVYSNRVEFGEGAPAPIEG
ncbi:hypothetical protein GGQ80_000598 [Sphingomonas jinjuensis]|uniref:Uncharacterized protein n=1 Tax=Sphingomonas jinjuensis TaxID=535907 RepID=A0A840F7Z7_9SPHN|nr:hypothetical protein [Sphingomonas jinjuensis]